MKTYNNLTDVEKHILREYQSWKYNNNVALGMIQLAYWRNRAIALQIDHLL